MTEGYVDSLPELMKYYGTPAAPIAHFPFNFKLVSLPAFRARPLKQAIDSWMEAMPSGGWAWANWLVGNHDNARVADRFGPALVDAVNAIVLLLPGTAVTYYGEELGMRGHPHISYEDTKDPAGLNAGPQRYQLFSRDPERTPMQWDASPNAGFSSGGANGEEPPTPTWLPVNPNYRTLNVEAQRKAEESHLKLYKTLVALRSTREWTHGGMETRVLDGKGEGGVFGFTRSLRGEGGILVLANLGAKKATTFDATGFEGVGTTATVYARSVGFGGEGVSEEKLKMEVGSSVDLSALSLEDRKSVV